MLSDHFIKPIRCRTQRSRQRRRQSGFTLIEAVVALVLVATLGLTIFSWLNGSLSTLQRIEENRAQDQATLVALEYIKLLNPMKRPSGQENLGTFQMQWVSTARSDRTDTASEGSGPGDFVVQLFDTRVTLSRAGRPQWVSFTVRTAGYEKVRSQSDTIFGQSIK